MKKYRHKWEKGIFEPGVIKELPNQACCKICGLVRTGTKGRMIDLYSRNGIIFSESEGIPECIPNEEIDRRDTFKYAMGIFNNQEEK